MRTVLNYRHISGNGQKWLYFRLQGLNDKLPSKTIRKQIRAYTERMRIEYTTTK